MFNPLQPDYHSTPVAPGRPAAFSSEWAGDEPPAVTLITLLRDESAPAGPALRQVLGQSFRAWEWLVLSRGVAPDGEWHEADPRVRLLVCPPDFTDAECYNRAAGAARSEALVFLDEADVLEPTALEQWLWALHARPWCPWVTGSTVYCGDHAHEEPLIRPTGAAFPSPGCSDRTFMIRRAVFEQQGRFREALTGGDERREFWHRCADAGLWGLRLPEYHKWTRLAPRDADAFKDQRDAERYRRRCRAHHSDVDCAPFPASATRTERNTLPQQLPCHNRLHKVRPRLLMLLEFFIAGGAEKVSLDAVAQLAGRGWDVTVIATGDADHVWLSEFARHTPDVFALQHFLAPEGRPADYPRFLHYLAGSRQFDAVLLCNSHLAYGLLPMLRDCLPGAAFADIRHAADWPILSQEAQPLLDLRVVSFTGLRDRIAALCPAAPPPEVVYTNVDVNLWRPAPPAKRREVRRSLGVAEDTPVILYTARLVDSKQPDVFARTVLALCRRGHRFVGVSVGDGPLLPWLRAFVEDNQLGDRLLVLGSTPAERLRELAASADVAFLPTREEGIAMVAFEAMACGLPVVSAAVGGMAELVLPNCGVLINSAERAVETQRYTDILADLLTRPDVRRQMGAESLERVHRHFRLDQMGERLDGLLRTALEGARGAPRPVSATVSATVAAVLRAESERHRAVLDRHIRALETGRPAEPARVQARAPRAGAPRRKAEPAARRLGPPRQVALDVTALIGQPLTGIQRVIFEMVPRVSRHCWDGGATVLLGHSLGSHFVPVRRWDRPVPAEAVRATLLCLQALRSRLPKIVRWTGGLALQVMKASGVKALLRRTPLRCLNRHVLKRAVNELLSGPPVRFHSDDAFIAFSVGTNPVRLPPEVDPGRVQLVLHDLIPLQRPEFVTPAFTASFGENLLPLVFGSRYRTADYRLVTPSNTVATDVGDFYVSLDCPAPAIDVVYWGYSRERFYPDPDPAFRRRLGIPDDALMVLAVSTVDPRKRFDRIARAVRALGERFPAYGVFIGHGGRDEAADGRVRFLGHVDDETLRRAYSTCDACVNWSACEGFGLPVIEALACGANVIVPPDNPTLREVGGHSVRVATAATVEGLVEALAAVRAGKRGPAAPAIDQYDWDRAARAFAINAGLLLQAPSDSLEARRAA